MATQFRVLGDGVTRELFAKIATEFGFVRAHVFDSHEDDYEESWVNSTRTKAIHYIEDSFSKLHYVSVHGDAAEQFVNDLGRRIALRDPGALIEDAWDDEIEPREQAANLFKIATTFSEYHPAAHQVFERYATASPNPLLRMAALDAIGLRAWEEIRPVVTKVARDDKDPEVRDHAKAVLERWTAARG